MGKKKNKDKKGKGAEKTQLKTDKRQEKKSKKQLAEAGEEDIEALIAKFKHEDRKKLEIVDEKCDPPTPRSNMTLTAHPDRDEIIMFGGEFYNGLKTFLYNDLLFYNCKRNEWTKVTSPNPPPPRCSHQACSLKQGGGQLWIFGGEFASPSQSQFYHYKDLWVLNLRERKWEEVRARGGPSSRSGHRMVAFKKQLLVFGGFNDNTRNYKYYNDLHAFNLETYLWHKIETVGIPPTPRSGCQMVVCSDTQQIVVYGGYSKVTVKRDTEKGVVHNEMYLLTPHESHKKVDESSELSMKWVQSKTSQFKPSLRSGMTATAVSGNKAIFFGGVYDEVKDDGDDDDDDDVQGNFFNDIFTLELDKLKWHETFLRGKTDGASKRRRRKDGGDDVAMGADETEPDQSCEESMDTDATPQPVYDDGIFTVTIGAQGAQAGDDTNSDDTNMDAHLFVPRPRINAQLVCSGGLLYVYGGVYEDGSKRVTLSDFYSIDPRKMDEFNVIIPDSSKKVEWVESDSSGSEDDEEDEVEEVEEEESEGGEDDMEASGSTTQ